MEGGLSHFSTDLAERPGRVGTDEWLAVVKSVNQVWDSGGVFGVAKGDYDVSEVAATFGAFEGATFEFAIELLRGQVEFGEKLRMGGVFTQGEGLSIVRGREA